MAGVRILAPTLLEDAAVRWAAPSLDATWAGVGLTRWHRSRDDAVVICGLAGGLKPGLPAGVVVVPRYVGHVDGRLVACDGELVETLSDAARALGFEVENGPMVTATALLVGRARGVWWGRGFVAADMETGLLAPCHRRVATVRVVLDTASHELDEEILASLAAFLHPRLWKQLWRLGRVAPAYALRAARVLEAGLARPPSAMAGDT
jgi:hypothetical protein